MSAPFTLPHRQGDDVPGRATCPVCGRDRISLRNNGQMRYHATTPTDRQGDRDRLGPRVPGKGCDGTGLTLQDAERWVAQS
jgi:hypothetical protein